MEERSVIPASDAEIAGIEPNIAKTEWQTCSNCDAGLRSINTPPYLIGTHEDYCILTMWPKVKARIEADRARIRELEEQVKRCHGIIQTLVAASDPEWTVGQADAAKELSGEFCPGQCTSECDRKAMEDADALATAREQNRAKDEEIARLKTTIKSQNRTIAEYQDTRAEQAEPGR